MKTFRALLALFAVSALGTAAVAHADTFAFSFGTTSSDFYGSGTLTGNMIAPGEFLITGVTGVTNTSGNHNNTSIEAVGTFENNDNDLFVSASGVGSLDDDGISYLLANGAQINLQTQSGNLDVEYLDKTGGKVVSENVTFAISATPEPGSFVLLGTGLLGMAGAMRRRLSM